MTHYQQNKYKLIKLMESNILDHVSVDDTLAIQQISNHPVMTNVERFVVLYGLNINAGHMKHMTMRYEIIHLVDNTVINIHPKNKPEWVISNNIRVMIRDENGETIPNPDYVPVYSTRFELNSETGMFDEIPNPEIPENIINFEEKYLTQPAFDFFKYIAWDNTSPLTKRQHFEFYIQVLDTEDNFFNFY